MVSFDYQCTKSCVVHWSYLCVTGTAEGRQSHDGNEEVWDHRRPSLSCFILDFWKWLRKGCMYEIYTNRQFAITLEYTNDVYTAVDGVAAWWDGCQASDHRANLPFNILTQKPLDTFQAGDLWMIFSQQTDGFDAFNHVRGDQNRCWFVLSQNIMFSKP